jgi:dTDP-4-amino-4,6-dideoxygalactose transaminase
MSQWPCYTDEEVKAATECLVSNKVNYWTGEECRKFEAEFSAWVGSKYAIALANGTVALDLALKALEIGAGDEVIVTPRTFIASASCIVNVGATPVFADVDLVSGNITAETIQKVITEKTKAIICVHLAGWPCDMDPIIARARDRGLRVIEDCAQAHGAVYKGRNVGSIGDVAAWSFCQDKIMTTGGEGGMVTTNSADLWQKMWSYKDHGKSYESVFEKKHPPGFRWVHDEFGTNYRMLEFQGAIGRVQLGKMKEWTYKRSVNAARLKKTCQESVCLRVPNFNCGNEGCQESCREALGCVHANYKFYAYVRPEYLREGWTRDRIISEINAKNIPCFQGSCSEVYLENAFISSGLAPRDRLQNAKILGETSLMFLIHPTITELEIESTCEIIKEVFSRAQIE